MPTYEKHIIRRTTLGAAAPAVAEALGLSMEQPGAGHIVTLQLKGDENVFAQLSTGLEGPASVLGTLPGPPLLRAGFGLPSRSLVRLARRGWILAGAADGMADYHSRDWDGVTTLTDRHLVAEEVGDVLTGLFGLPTERSVTVYVNFGPRR